MFADRFGNSSLAFMQPCKITGDSEKPISDHMWVKLTFRARKIAMLMIHRILAPSDGDFKLFLDILEESQGGLLRRFSNAASKIVSHLISI